jgi:hypothetical protein
VIATLPLRLRNRLAETILGALHDASARRELAGLAEESSARRWLADDEARWVDALTARARVALTALDDRPLLESPAELGPALGAAAALFDAGLFFEVHEVLEPHWAAASGETREALQGLIQISVAWQHLANGNRAGARSLLGEGGARLHGARLLGTDLEPFARAAGEAAGRLTAGLPLTPPRFPFRPHDGGRRERSSCEARPKQMGPYRRPAD